jgi:hypothetical protein
MIEPRLAAELLVSALRRQADANGAFATIMRKGDRTSGSILLVRREKGRNPVLFEHISAVSGGGRWVEIPSQHIDNEQYISDYLARRLNRDPDLWIVELDVPFVERFTDILAAIA